MTLSTTRKAAMTIQDQLTIIDQAQAEIDAAQADIEAAQARINAAQQRVVEANQAISAITNPPPAPAPEPPPAPAPEPPPAPAPEPPPAPAPEPPPAPAPEPPPAPAPEPPPAPAPEPPPAPAPEPPPAPAPEPPPAQVLPEILQLNQAALAVFARHGSPAVGTVPAHLDTAWFEGGSPYTRQTWPGIAKGSSWVFQVFGLTGTTGVRRNLTATVCHLLIDGVDSAVATPVGSVVEFNVQLATVAEGWHKLDVTANSAESFVPWFVYVQHGDAPVPQPTMPVYTHPHDCQKHGWSMYAYAWVPAQVRPVVEPFPARATPAFSDAKDRRSMIELQLVPGQMEAGPFYYPRTTENVMHQDGEEAYYYYSISAKMSRLILRDGPRGVGTVAMPMHIQVMHTGGAWVCEPWRVIAVKPDGEVITLAGRRHVDAAPNYPPIWASTDDDMYKGTELVGDWSEVPVAKRGFHELWGLAWITTTLHPHSDTETVMINGVPSRPHNSNPMACVPDSLNNRICTIEGDKLDPRFKPMKVREFITDLNDPWDNVFVDGLLYVSERGANRIVAYNMDGTLNRVVIDGGPTAGLLKTGATAPAGWVACVQEQDRFVRRLGSITAIRALPCCLPEGLYHLDGWLYFGSIANGQVRKINLATGELQTVVTDIPYSYSSTNFCKIAVSDGSFGPRGSIFLVTWSINPRGRPLAFLPNGTPWAYNTVSYVNGPGLEWATVGYHSAVGVGGGPSTLPPGDPGHEASSLGKLMYGTSSYGLRQISLAQGDRSYTGTECKNMEDAWRNRFLQITHGDGGWGKYGLPQPWGLDPNVDAYLEAHGHTKPV